MIDRLEVLNRERQAGSHGAGQPFLPFRIGIGINTGRCVVGNLGSDLRFNYSVLGDPVNVAARLEGQTKFYGVPIIIGSRTGEKAKEKFAILELDLITVKGKTEPQTIYALLGREEIAGDSRLPGIAQAMVNDDVLLSQPRLGRRVRGDRVVSVGRAQFWSCGLYLIYTEHAYRLSEKVPRLRIGQGFLSRRRSKYFTLI